MERLDQLMVQCREDIADIASSECDITSTSNRLLYELATVRQSTTTKSDQDAVKMNIEAMLNILIAYTSSDSAAFCSSIPAVQPSQRGVIKQHCTVTDLQEVVQNKTKQIKKSVGLINVIIEAIQKEITK